ncbi:MAG: hypothetical protein K8S97_03120 [Anaerolineae bacterium]|nr:hypothetical protein [Anaerolineae bacterium]
MSRRRCIIRTRSSRRRCSCQIIGAPESAHAIRAAIVEALEAKETGEERVILFNLSGHGHFDMASYEAYFAGSLKDYAYPAAAVADAQTRMPQIG